MRGANRTILIALPLLALVAAYWLLVLSPKRDEASQLEDEVTQLQASADTLEQEIAAAEQARRDFPESYRKLVVLGKAVPEGDDQPALFVELTRISKKAKVQFRGLSLSDAGGSAPPPPPPPAETETPTDGSEPASADEGEAAPPPPPAAATEAAAAGLPIGAAIGPAGLPVMPYEMEIEADFFHVADFFAGLDRLVRVKRADARVKGRLVTIDGFSLERDPKKDFPSLLANVAVTTYVSPPGEGLSGGATPSGPAPVGPAGEPVPASSAPADDAATPASSEVTP